MNEMLAFAVLSQVQGRPGVGSPIGSAPVFSAQSAPAGTVGTPYSYQFVANGAPAYSLGSGSFPAGLTLDPMTGILSGTPTIATGYTFTVNATNGNGTTPSTSQSVTIAAGGGGDSRITPSLVLSRTSGSTPLAVLMDAKGTTCSVTDVADTFRQLKYDIDYGDSAGGTWAVTSLPKNSDTGAPEFGHLYATAQISTITLTITVGLPWVFQSNKGIATPYKTNDFVYVDPAGGSSPNTYKALNNHNATASFATDLGAGHWTLVQAGKIQNSTTASLTITAANTTYSGANTVAINVVGDADFSLAPSNSTHTNSNSALAPPADGIRHLYKKGSTFSGSVSIPGNAGWTDRAVQIGSYGSGARPIISGGIEVGTYSGGTPTAPLNGAVVYGIDMNGNECGNNTWVKNTLVWDCAFTAAQWAWRNVDVSFFENAVQGTGISGSDNNYNFFLGNGNDGFISSNMMALGNVANTATFHTIRVPTCQVGVFAHNWFKGQAGASPGGEVFKLHQNTQQTTPNASLATRYVVMRDNWVSDASNTTLGLGCGAMPENATYAEVLQDCVIERQNCRTSIEDWEFGGVRMTARGCTTVASACSFQAPGSHGYPSNPNLSAYNGPYFQA